MRLPGITTALLTAILLAPPLALASEDNRPAIDANTLLPVTGSPTASPGDSEIKARLAGGGPLSIAGGRGTMSNRGEKTVWDADNKRKNEKLSDAADLKKFIKVGDWNDVVLVANGNHITYTINGNLTTDLTDESPKAVKEGLIGLQLHQGFNMEIQFKDLKIKLLNK